MADKEPYENFGEQINNHLREMKTHIINKEAIMELSAKIVNDCFTNCVSTASKNDLNKKEKVCLNNCANAKLWIRNMSLDHANA